MPIYPHRNQVEQVAGAELGVVFLLMLRDLLLLMAERTILVGPLSEGIGLDHLQKEFSGLAIERMALLAEKAIAYVQLRSADEVEALSNRYPNCHVPALADAEIGLVEGGFKWPTFHATARADCLVVVRNCEGVGGLSETRIRQIFKKFAIEKVARFEESSEVVVEFHSQDDLELIDMEFDNLRVPDLGPKAEIEVDNAFPVDRFLQRYLQRNQLRVIESPEKQESPLKQSPFANAAEEERVRKEVESKRKMEEMERDILEKEKVRRSEAETAERARREREERERVERFAREKRERDEREKREERQRRELMEQEERKKQEALRKDQEEEKRRRAEEEQTRREAEVKLQEQRELAERIAAIKLEVEAEESKIRQREQEKESLEGIEQGESQLQRILNQEKQEKEVRKKEIKLPELNQSDIKQNPSESQAKQESGATSRSQSGRQVVERDYSKTCRNFITAVFVAWIYYILVR